MALIIGDQFANLLPSFNTPDFVFGLAGNDTLLGSLGADALDGGSGIDTANYAASFASVTVNLGSLAPGVGGTAQGDTYVGIENVTGSAFGDDLRGNAVRNVLIGLDGDDDLRGLDGNDDLLGGAGDDTLDGGTGNDLLTGGGDNDSLIGGTGADTMAGGAGNDSYVFGTGDSVSEVGGSGIDTIKSSISVNLLSAAITGGVENIDLTGSGNINATGDGLNNTLLGNSGDNRLDGGTGFDTMDGGAGDDTYLVSSGFDRVTESALAAGGVDTVISSVTFDLRGAQVGNIQTAVENLDLSGAGVINAIGNSLGNILSGNSAANSLNGFAGNDTLTGEGGADTFVFQTALNAGTNVDMITDFNVAQDTIRLENLFFTGLANGALDPDAFHIGASAQDADDRIIYRASTGAVSFDVDGVGGVAAVRFATLDTGLAMTSLDFTVF